MEREVFVESNENRNQFVAHPTSRHGLEGCSECMPMPLMVYLVYTAPFDLEDEWLDVRWHIFRNEERVIVWVVPKTSCHVRVEVAINNVIAMRLTVAPELSWFLCMCLKPHRKTDLIGGRECEHGNISEYNVNWAGTKLG